MNKSRTVQLWRKRRQRFLTINQIALALARRGSCDGCIHWRYKWIIDQARCIADPTTVSGRRPCFEAHAEEESLIGVEERGRTVRMVLGVAPNAKHQATRRRG